MALCIRRFSEPDPAATAAIHGEAFPRQGHSRDWIASNARACGFILWTEKSGFRGKALIRDSLGLVAKDLAARAARLKAVLVSTRADNDAQRLYRKALGAEIEATLPSLYSGDEVLMVSRRPPP